MTGKQITELESTNKISEGDLLFVRKTTSGTDKKINYTDLVESIGNPAIDGFVAIVAPLDENTIILTPTNNARIPRYFVGMKISFVSPITSTGSVKIKVGSLTAKDFVQYQTTSTVILGVNDYVEGVFITDKFHRINDLRSVANIYSNEYNVILTTIDPSEQFTTLNLVSSIGIPKQSYYDGMAISFITPENTKGVTLIHIDGITETKTIFEPDLEDFISLPLYANQIVHAIYKTAQGGFIRDRFSVQDPTVSEPIIPSIDNPDEPYIPPQNIFEFTVGANEKFKNLQEAVQKLTQEFGQDGGGRKVTLLIKDTLTKTSSIDIINSNLSWMILKGVSNIININLFDVTYPGASYFSIYNSTFFRIAPNTTIQCSHFNNSISLFSVKQSTAGLDFDSISIIDTDSNSYRLFSLNKSSVELKNCAINGGKEVIYATNHSFLSLENCIIKSYTTRALSLNEIATCNIRNCDLSKNGTSDASNIFIQDNGAITVNQFHSKAKSNLAPNVTSYGVIYKVTGSQDIQGN